MPSPRKNESRADWMERCIPFVMKENKNNPQAVAICVSIYNDKDKGTAESEYGRCPECGSYGAMRERRINGDDVCLNGHKYPSANAIHIVENE